MEHVVTGTTTERKGVDVKHVWVLVYSGGDRTGEVRAFRTKALEMGHLRSELRTLREQGLVQHTRVDSDGASWEMRDTYPTECLSAWVVRTQVEGG